MTKPNLMTKACCVFLLWAATAVATPAQTFTTLLNFDNSNGGYPQATLIQGTDGSFYATTEGAEAASAEVFKLTPSGTFSVLTGFGNGFFPLDYGGLVLGTDGDFYGTTWGDGYNDGTVFKITPGGTLTTLHDFEGSDGAQPYAGLVLGADGKFYGTTSGGGNETCFLGCGTIFSITPGGTLTTLHTFDGTDGKTPVSGLVEGTNGTFYGTTEYGGANDDGTVFSITRGGVLTTLHSFDVTDGENPIGGLVQAANGDFYGTTEGGGTSGICGGFYPCGTIFEITASGTLTTLHNFCSVDNCADGYTPAAALIQATDGNFYGTAGSGGLIDCEYSTGCGTVFKITPGGTLTTLHSFEYTDGAYPDAGLVEGTDGIFYGSARLGGTDNYGTIFSLSVGLKPFVKTEPTSGVVGTAVNILGTNLTEVTSVTFDGTPAVFSVDSHSLITTTVPAGATTGKVEVAGPNGMAFSNVPFLVRP